MTEDQSAAAGPLAGLRVVEFVSIGPGPHCAMLLSDLDADILRIDREGGNGWPNPIVDRGRAIRETDIRTPEGRDFCLEAGDLADVVIEGFRPGVMERLGLGPEVLLSRNPRLVYGRITGWGQTGPLAQRAGHDITYIALAGALAAMGKQSEAAQPPLNLVGDFGGGSMLLALGILAALVERQRSGEGQVIDAAIVDGVSSLMTMFAGLLPSGAISLERDRNLLGGSAPYYRCYVCADGKELAVGCLEPHFYRTFLEILGAPASLFDDRDRVAHWPEQARYFAAIFATQPASHWEALFEGSDACVAPVLPLHTVPDHPHMQARAAYIEHGGLRQSAPVPRFSRTPGAIQSPRTAEDMIAAWKRAAPAQETSSCN